MFCRGGGGEPTRCAAGEGPCPPAPSRGGARAFPRSAHQNGHFPSSWKMFEMPRAVGRNRAEHFFQSCFFLCLGGSGGQGSLARGGRVTVRRRTRRFGHAALAPCSVFAPRRTTRRQCRVWLGWHQAAGRAKRARAPPCLSSLHLSFFSSLLRGAILESNPQQKEAF